MLEASTVIVRADDDLFDAEPDQGPGVLDAPLAGTVRVGGGEHAEAGRGDDILLALHNHERRVGSGPNHRGRGG